MEPINAHMCENAYGKQMSMYSVQNKSGQFYGFGSFVSDVEGKVYPDREPYDEEKLAKDKKILGAKESFSWRKRHATIKKTSSFRRESEMMDR